MEEDNNEGGCNNENDDPDDAFLIDTSIFNRWPEHIMNDLFFVQYPSNGTEALGSFNELLNPRSTSNHQPDFVQK